MPGTHICDASLIAQDHDFRAAVNTGSIFGARRYGPACAELGVDDFAGAVGMQGTGDAADDSRDLSFFGGERALVRHQDGGQEPEDERTAGKSTER